MENKPYRNSRSLTATFVAHTGNAIRFSPSPFSINPNFSAEVGTCIWFLLHKQNMFLVIVLSKYGEMFH